MKRFAKLALLALVAAVAPIALPARAGFEEDDVRSLANQIKRLADKTIADIANDRMRLPAAERSDFLLGLGEISRQAAEVGSGSQAKHEDAGENPRLPQARAIQSQMRQLAQRARDIDHRQLEELLAVGARLSAQLADELE
jgi:hypothetical protein